MDITKTELVWPGKYTANGIYREVPRISLPFQVIESVNEIRSSKSIERTKQLTLFDVWKGDEGESFDSGWKNKLIWGDNLLVMGSLLKKYAGKIDLIYLDPPFATGADFSVSTQIGDENLVLCKERSIIEEKAYRDTWGRGIDSYLNMMYDRLYLMHELLSDSGSIYLHCDYRVHGLIRLIMDSIFDSSRFVNEIVWERSANTSSIGKIWKRSHDTILFYTKSNTYTFNFQRKPLSEASLALYDNEDSRGNYQLVPILVSGKRSGETGKPWKNVDPNRRGRNGMHWVTTPRKLDDYERQGLIVWPKKVDGVPRLKYYLNQNEGVVVSDMWDDIKLISSSGKESTGYATQKPEALLERIIKTSSNEGDLVADLFLGSGTTIAVAEKLERRWIGCDLGRFAIHTTRKRLLEIDGCKPFEILNLGKYERQYWQMALTGDVETRVNERTFYEYLAFILRLYGAQPVAGFMHIHGKKGRAMVHIGSVDAPVTIDEISAALSECIQLKQLELHVLGWEWEMGLAGPNNDYKKGSLMHDESKKRGVKLLLLQIPRDVMEQQAVDKGDIQFFELAYLEVEIERPRKLAATVSLKDFVIPNTELIPEDIREKVSKWSDYIDYWAVDWDFRNDTFIQGWVAYRTRQDRSLPLKSEGHTYEKPGKYRILVKVVDIFGNDTSQAYDVQVV